MSAGISPSLNATVTAKRGNVWSDSISVNGNNDEYFRHNPDLLRRGRAIDVLDVENNARVCLVDGDAAKTLFFGEDPVGQTFYLDGFEYTVVGMIDEDENASLFSQILMGGKTDGTVYVPYSSAKSCWAPHRHRRRGLCHRSGRHGCGGGRTGSGADGIFNDKVTPTPSSIGIHDGLQ